VYEWGVLGDGTFNETLKIQRALDNLQHVYFPPGTYLVDGSLTASLDKQVIEGAGKGSVIKMMASKTYDLTQQNAALTMNAGEQTLQDLQFVGPDTGDDSTFSGSGSDWYNLAALRVDGPSSFVNGVKIDRCEGVGIHVSQTRCKVSLCTVEQTGLDGLRTTALRQSVFGLHVTGCKQSFYSNITTYPSEITSAARFNENDTVISECYLDNNTRDIMCEGATHAISNNICFSGVHVAATHVIMSNNTLGANSGNALTVANDGTSFISSLTGNDVRTMDQGGADDIIARSSYSQKPVLKASSNENADIDRIYQLRAYSQIQPNETNTNGDGSVQLKNIEEQQVINAAYTDTITIARPGLVQITMPPAYVNTNFSKGRFAVKDNSGSTANFVNTQVGYDNSTGYYFLVPSTLQVRLQPNVIYQLHLFSDTSETRADVSFDNNWKITIIDLE